MSGMAEVLAAHQPTSKLLSPSDVRVACLCGQFAQDDELPTWHNDWIIAHQAAALTAAGFGPVKEAAAAGLRSVQDIWGAGGRVTVRMGEIRDADQAILSGEWDNHIKWNMADIAKERTRAATIREAS